MSPAAAPAHRRDPVLGFIGILVAFALFVCTAMIYASVKFLEEWHSPYTVGNFLFLGMASGFMLAAAYSAYLGNHLVGFYGTWAVIFTLLGLATRTASLIRNATLKHKSTCRPPSASAIAPSSRSPRASPRARSTPASSSTTRAPSS
jgi:DMSO reductase anchor subunit